MNARQVLGKCLASICKALLRVWTVESLLSESLPTKSLSTEKFTQQTPSFDRKVDALACNVKLAKLKRDADVPVHCVHNNAQKATSNFEA